MQVDDGGGVWMAYLQLGISVRLMANEALRALLHDCGSVRGLDGHFRAARREREELVLDIGIGSCLSRGHPICRLCSN